MEIVSAVVTEVMKHTFLPLKRGISYVFLYEKKLKNFEKKVESLAERKDRVQRKVDAAENNGEKIHTDVNSWLSEADNIINVGSKQVEDLHDKANIKCFIGLCPNFKYRYQLSRIAEKDVRIAEELFQQGGFDEVSYRDVPQPIAFAPSKDFEAFDSRKHVFHEIMEAVKDPNIKIIGVYGMPGVGKTTLAREVGAQVKVDKLLFNKVVFADVTHTPDIQKIQGQIAGTLGLRFVEQDVTERASRLHERLKKEEKILVVLDDIWARLDLMKVGIPFGNEHEGCTILLTSRDANVLKKDMDAKRCFPIEALKQEEAWDLFKKMAGDGVETPDLRPIATEVAKKCGGLPVAINALARSLRDEPPFEWEDALQRLNNPSSSDFRGVPPEVYIAIELSYNRLMSEEHKQTFLLCSLLGHNVNIQDLLKYAMGLGLFHGVSTVKATRNRLLTVVNHLNAACLLLDSYSSGFFYMHDLICDVALSIASKGNCAFALKPEAVLIDWPEEETMKECNKISLWGSISQLPDKLKCPKLTFLHISSKDPSLEIPTSLFQETEDLKVLDLTKMDLPDLPSSISQLANLQTLCLDQCVLVDISLIGELKNLEILSLLLSDIEMLPKEIGELIKLKLFDLSGCSRLEKIPSGIFCKLSRLEELYMSNSFVQWEAEEHVNQQSNASLAELMSLSCLTVLDVHIPDAQIIPKDFSFEKLQRYNILIGEEWDWERVGDIEYSRTLKLKLHTSIGFLNNGIKALLKKAENLYLDEMTGLENLLHESEAKDYFLQLKNLHIQNGAMIQHILEGSKIEFPQLQSLTLHNLPRLISFCSRNHGSSSISPPEIALFNPKVVFPKLEKLNLSSIGIESIWLSQGFCSTQNLTSLIIKGCHNLKNVLSYSSVEYLKQLKCLEITECECIQEIISTEEIINGNRARISFPQLNSLKLKGLQKLIGFCNDDYTVEFQALKILGIENCPNLTGFTHKSTSRDIPTDRVLFNQKVALPNLEKMTISHLRNVERIWFKQLHNDSFSNLKELIIDYCEALFNIFPPFLLGVFQRLEIIKVTDCDSLEEVFHVHIRGSDVEETCIMTSQLKEMHLVHLPKLKHIWNKDPNVNISFGNLRQVYVQLCWSLKTLFPFSIARDLHQLESLNVDSCSVEEIVSKNIKGSNEQEIWFEFNQVSFLMLWNLPDLTCFYPGTHRTRWPELKQLKTYGCPKIKMIGYGEAQIQPPLFLVEELIGQLEKVTFNSDDVAMISDSQLATESLCHIKFLEITKSDIFPFSFLQRFSNLEILVIFDSNFKELSLYEGEKMDVIITCPKIKLLKLEHCRKIQYLWNQESPLDHICATLETLEVYRCESLINLSSASSSFQNLTTLDVWECKEMAELITSSKAQSLERLVSMKIRECKMMKEVIATKEDESPYPDEIVFRELKYLELYGLQNLKSFCSGNHTFKFPSLEKVILNQCPRLENFFERALSTPKLQKVQLTGTDYKGSWVGDLNATVKQLYKEQVGYRGLKNLKFSEIPELIDIWSRNPQEKLDFKIIEFIEVCDSNNLTWVFNLPMALSLGRLQHLEIRRCSNLTQVIKEASSITVVEEATSSNIISIFPRLKSIIVESCADMTSFYMGSTTLECLSLTQIEVEGCPNMTSFGSTFFYDKVVFPKLEKLKLSSIGIGSIWLSQGFCSTQNLTSLIIEGCTNLKHVLSYSNVEYLKQLKCLEITECESIQDIISTEEKFTGNRATISFPQLNSLKLKGLRKLIGICNEDHTVEFQALKILEIENCPHLTGFTHKSTNRDIHTDRVLFNQKVALPNLEKMTISHLGDVKRIWYSQLHMDSFSNLKELKVDYCEALFNIFPSFLLSVFQRLEILKVTDCDSLEEVFQLHVQGSDVEETCLMTSQLKVAKFETYLEQGPHVNISFGNLRQVCVEGCWNLRTLFPFSIARDLHQLESLDVQSCGLAEIVSKNIKGSNEQEVWFEFNQVCFLKLWILPNLVCFYPGRHRTRWPELKQLKTYYCPKIKMIGYGESQIQPPLFLIEELIGQLEKVTFNSDDVAMISDSQLATESLCHIKFLEITKSDIFPFSFLQRFSNLEILEIFDSNFKELSLYGGEKMDVIITRPKIKMLKLDLCRKILYLWNQESPLYHMCATLETLQVWRCERLINLSSASLSFQNLTTLDVWKCEEMAQLIASSKAQSLERLVTIRIRESKMMKEVIASTGDHDEIVFIELKYLELHCLQNLKSFCSGNHTFKFPSLELVILSECPRLENFCERALSTPKLQKVQLMRTDYKGRWAGDLNSTVEQLYKEQVGYRGLKNLMFSEIPELIDIWSRNPQEKLLNL